MRSTTNPLLCWSQAQKENYRQEKKRATKQLFSALTDPSVVIMADSLKVGSCATHRGSCRTGHLWHLGGESKCLSLQSCLSGPGLQRQMTRHRSQFPIGLEARVKVL